MHRYRWLANGSLSLAIISLSLLILGLAYSFIGVSNNIHLRAIFSPQAYTVIMVTGATWITSGIGLIMAIVAIFLGLWNRRIKIALFLNVIALMPLWAGLIVLLLKNILRLT